MYLHTLNNKKRGKQDTTRKRMTNRTTGPRQNIFVYVLCVIIIKAPNIIIINKIKKNIFIMKSDVLKKNCFWSMLIKAEMNAKERGTILINDIKDFEFSRND